MFRDWVERLRPRVEFVRRRRRRCRLRLLSLAGHFGSKKSNEKRIRCRFKMCDCMTDKMCEVENYSTGRVNIRQTNVRWAERGRSTEWRKINPQHLWTYTHIHIYIEKQGIYKKNHMGSAQPNPSKNHHRKSQSRRHVNFPPSSSPPISLSFSMRSDPSPLAFFFFFFDLSSQPAFRFPSTVMADRQPNPSKNFHSRRKNRVGKKKEKGGGQIQSSRSRLLILATFW